MHFIINYRMIKMRGESKSLDTFFMLHGVKLKYFFPSFLYPGKLQILKNSYSSQYGILKEK